MNSMDNTEMHDLKTDSLRAPQPVHGLSSETERGPEDPRTSIPDDKLIDAPRVEDAGPPDGGTAAWLSVLGAWCCSFSSPGWINSTSFPTSQCLPRFSLRGTQQRRNELIAILLYQALAVSNSTTRLGLCIITPVVPFPGFRRSRSSSCSPWGLSLA